jgi:hypothetical protein
MGKKSAGEMTGAIDRSLSGRMIPPFTIQDNLRLDYRVVSVATSTDSSKAKTMPIPPRRANPGIMAIPRPAAWLKKFSKRESIYFRPSNSDHLWTANRVESSPAFKGPLHTGRNSLFESMQQIHVHLPFNCRKTHGSPKNNPLGIPPLPTNPSQPGILLT